MGRESKLVAKIARAFPSHAGGRRDATLRLGIGDDAAVIASRANHDWVLSCDAFLEGVHFLAKTHPPDSVGFKSLCLLYTSQYSHAAYCVRISPSPSRLAL